MKRVVDGDDDGGGGGYALISIKNQKPKLELATTVLKCFVFAVVNHSFVLSVLLLLVERLCVCVCVFFFFHSFIHSKTWDKHSPVGIISAAV